VSEEEKLVTAEALQRAVKSIYEEMQKNTDEKLKDVVANISSISDHIIVDASDKTNIKIGFSKEMEAKIDYIYQAIQDGIILKDD
jgi:hypothetical protein